MSNYEQQIDEEVQSIVVIHDDPVESIAVNMEVPTIQKQKTMKECVQKMPACCNIILVGTISMAVSTIIIFAVTMSPPDCKYVESSQYVYNYTCFNFTGYSGCRGHTYSVLYGKDYHATCLGHGHMYDNTIECLNLCIDPGDGVYMTTFTSYAAVSIVSAIIVITICTVILLSVLACYGCYARTVYKKYFKEEIDQDEAIQDEEIHTKPAR
tara:strand:+ start:1089 stop:1721 length:633 start_codon:yes stop_codon:yes gene_type:complete